MAEENLRDSPSGNRPASLAAAIPGLTARLADVWLEGGARPDLGRTFTAREQSARGKHLARFVRALLAETKHLPLAPGDREAVQKRIFGAFESFARAGLGWEDRHIGILFGGGFDRAANEFVRRARDFDSGASSGDIFQACRNIWVANGLQRLLGLPVGLTSSIFAYSLLYPYTDNYLDDPETTEETKHSFNRRLRVRLEGGEVKPDNPREKQIFDLVAMIEEEHDRTRRPQVFESLLAIHEAQVKSLRLLGSDRPLPEAEALRIALEKGGTSVLADGCLAAGTLTPKQVEFLFGFGAFLQLMDDLEDVDEDAEAGLRTLFSRTAGLEPLDSATDRTFRLGLRVLEGLGDFGVPDAEPLRELIRSSLMWGLAATAGRFRKHFSRRYLKALEAHSPFRFSFYNRQRRKLTRRRARLNRLFESVSSS
jgi:hypothetical protein